ncbi:MAG TPA: oligosaccharide flippase family protein, partial [Polyangia bacterium]
MHLAGATMIGGARTAHNTLLRLLAALAQLLRGLIVVPLMARSFGPESYGLFAAALSLVSIGRTLIWNVGPVLTAAIVREPGREAVLLRGAAREIAACAVVLWLAFGGIAVGWYHDRSAVVLVLVLGVSLFTDVVALRGASLSARAQEGALTVFQTVASLTSVAAVVVVCKLGGGTRAIAAAFALCALLHAVLIARASARVAPAPAPAAQATRHLVLRLAAPALFINLAGALSSNVDLVLLGHWSGAVALGSYAAASRMLGVGMLLPNAVAAAAVPALAADRARGLERCIRVTALLGFVAIPVAAFAGFYAPAAPWLLGRSYAAATALVPLLAGR